MDPILEALPFVLLMLAQVTAVIALHPVRPGSPLGASRRSPPLRTLADIPA